MKATKGFAIAITGEGILSMLRKQIKLPDDSFLLKVVPSRYATNCYSFLFTSKEGFEILEEEEFPVISDKEDLPK